jgi:hypothetical protein
MVSFETIGGASGVAMILVASQSPKFGTPSLGAAPDGRQGRTAAITGDRLEEPQASPKGWPRPICAGVAVSTIVAPRTRSAQRGRAQCSTRRDDLADLGWRWLDAIRLKLTSTKPSSAASMRAARQRGRPAHPARDGHQNHIPRRWQTGCRIAGRDLVHRALR